MKSYPPEILFRPLTIGGLSLANRLVMAPMTRCFAPGGMLSPQAAEYYARRARHGIGLIITEGTWIPHFAASDDENVPQFFGERALAAWAIVLAEVHKAGGKIIPQLWHVGQTVKPPLEGLYGKQAFSDCERVGPSGIVGGMGVPLSKTGIPMTQAEIDAVTEAYVQSAISAYQMGFDGIELHGAHGYLIDQFFWKSTNRRTDSYGGGAERRARFAAEIVAEIRKKTSPDFPIVLRISQWKSQDYDAKIAESPHELERLLTPLVIAGVDIFDCSQRRYWEPEFDGPLNLAGWTRKVTGKPTISVGSVGLKKDVVTTLKGESSDTTDIDRALEMMERGDFDLLAIGRSLIADAEWPHKVRDKAYDKLVPYTPDLLTSLI